MLALDALAECIRPKVSIFVAISPVVTERKNALHLDWNWARLPHSGQACFLNNFVLLKFGNSVPVARIQLACLPVLMCFSAHTLVHVKLVA